MNETLPNTLPQTLPQLSILPVIPERDSEEVEELLSDWLGGLKPASQRAYTLALRTFAAFNDKTPIETVKALLSSRGTAQKSIDRWRNDMMARIENGIQKRTNPKSKLPTMSPCSCDMFLSAIRSLLKKALRDDLISWAIHIKATGGKSYKKTLGLLPGDIQRILDIAWKQEDRLKAARDVAIVRILFDCALRRSELCSLNIGDFNPLNGEHGSLEIIGKGRSEPELVFLSCESKRAIEHYLSVRDEPGSTAPLFMRIQTPGKPSGRLSKTGLYLLVRSIAEKAGIENFHPHLFRHSAITECLRRNGGDVVKAKGFSRHASVETLMVYSRQLQQSEGKEAGLVASSVQNPDFDSEHSNS